MDARELDQLLFALDGNAEGVVNIRIYRRYGQMSIGGGKTDVWVAGEIVTDIGVHGHASTTSLSSAAVAVNTLGADRVHLLVTKLTTLTTAYIHPYALKSLDGKPISLPYPLPEIAIVAGSEVKITDGTDDLAISSQGAALVVGDAAHDAADTGNPLKIGGKAATSEPSAVSAGDRVNAYFDTTGYLMVKPQGTAAHGDADVGAPIKVGAKATAVEVTVDEGDRANLSVDLSSRLRAIIQGLAAHDAAAAGNPVRAGGVYHSTPPTGTNGDILDLLTDAAGRQITVPAGDAADDAADAGNPVKVGGKATATQPALDANDRGNLSLTLGGRLRVDADDDYIPVKGGLLSLAVTAVSAQVASELAVGTKYFVFGTEHMHLRASVASDTATTSDSLLPKEVMLGFRPQAGETYLQAIRVSSDGTLYVWKGER